ncbi:hypothetical protein B0T16DRAFT_426037 [Cercophora newfieldiana]|uniref:Nitronate monooxygenase domain-containing protein n=1 Tax=Cercophora newfieldiana TaxID=92897 RepID=A0AA40D060_9PEZI|nr:hypothetical protein B0T16DRAFT_426037 [Cercophora newfieldiana]
MLRSIQAITHRSTLQKSYPWLRPPFIIAAPMRVFTGPNLVLCVARAGGLGFIGPGLTPASTAEDLRSASEILSSAPFPPAFPGVAEGTSLPLGVGFQMWNGDLESATSAVRTYKPAAAWLFAPREGQAETERWIRGLREASPETKVWLQIGTLSEALEAVRGNVKPDVLVVQGAEAGGHGRTNDGIGFVTLLPEIADAIAKEGKGDEIPLIAAGGILDGRGVAAALGLGAAGVAMGTRFLASEEARIKKGYQDEVVRAGDGAKNTVRTHLYNHMRGTFGWPEQWAPRTIVNKSWEEKQAGVEFDELKRRHDELLKEGDKAWGPEGRTATYAGAGIGLVKEVKSAGQIVEDVRGDARAIIQALNGI